MSTRSSIATHAAAAIIGGTLVLLCVKTCNPSPSRTAAAGSASAAASSVAVPAPSSAPERDAGPVRSIPVIVKFNVPNPRVNVTQRDNGTLEVVNTDPKLTGTQLPVEGVTADGRVLTFDVRVPAPRAHQP